MTRILNRFPSLLPLAAAVLTVILTSAWVAAPDAPRVDDEQRVLVLELQDNGTATFGNQTFLGYAVVYLDAGAELVLTDGGAPYPTVVQRDSGVDTYRGSFTLLIKKTNASTRTLAVKHGALTVYSSEAAARAAGALYE